MVIRQTATLSVLCAALLLSSLGSAQASRINHDHDPEQKSARIAVAPSYALSVDAKNFDLKSDAVRLTLIIDFGFSPRIKLAGTGRL